MWLLRGLSFTCKALQNTQANKTQELSAAFTASYEATLKKFHGILIRPVFTVSYITSVIFFHYCRLGKWGDGRERGNEAKFVHIRGSAATFFSLASIPVVVCRV